MAQGVASEPKAADKGMLGVAMGWQHCKCKSLLNFSVFVFFFLCCFLIVFDKHETLRIFHFAPYAPLRLLLSTAIALAFSTFRFLNSICFLILNCFIFVRRYCSFIFIFCAFCHCAACMHTHTYRHRNSCSCVRV